MYDEQRPVKEMPTKVLLDEKNSLRSVLQWNSTICEKYGSDSDIWKAKQKRLAEILEELKTRPHIPNKVEAKLLRQQKAKDKKNR